MRKTIIPNAAVFHASSVDGSWLNLDELATVELSSEDPEHPFEDALRSAPAGGWKAATAGPQAIRLRFDHPQTVRRVHLEFREDDVERAQEIALFATVSGSTRREIQRQQWFFSPRGANSEIEDYYFDLRGVTLFELEIDPGRHDRGVFASLQSIRIG